MGPIGPIGLIGSVHISPIGHISPIRLPAASVGLLLSAFHARRVPLLAFQGPSNTFRSTAFRHGTVTGIIRVHVISGIVIWEQPR